MAARRSPSQPRTRCARLPHGSTGAPGWMISSAGSSLCSASEAPKGAALGSGVLGVSQLDSR